MVQTPGSFLQRFELGRVWDFGDRLFICKVILMSSHHHIFKNGMLHSGVHKFSKNLGTTSIF